MATRKRYSAGQLSFAFEQKQANKAMVKSKKAKAKKTKAKKAKAKPAKKKGEKYNNSSPGKTKILVGTRCLPIPFSSTFVNPFQLMKPQQCRNI